MMNRHLWKLIVCVQLVGLLLPIQLWASSEVGNKYHDCLKKRTEDYSWFKTVGGRATAVIHQQGKIVVLECHHCEHPSQPYPDEAFKWYRRSHLTATNEEIKENKKFEFNDLHSLVIHEISVDDSGLYSCVVGEATQSIYHADVVSYLHVKKVVLPYAEGPHPAPAEYFDSYNVEVFTEWQPWAQCGQCGVDSERRRQGACTVKRMDKSGASSGEEDLSFLRKYPKGVPCQSLLLPDSIAQIPQIRNRSNEVQSAGCYQPCTTPVPVKVITDKNKQVVEVVEVAKGFVSLREGKLPKPPKLVKRSTTYRTVGSSVLLICPHADASLTHVRWQNGTQVLDTATVSVRTHGRVTVDPLNRLVITQLHYTDTAAYSCWIHGKHIATLKIRVVQGLQQNLSDYVILAGVGLTMLTLVYIGVQAVMLNRTHHRTMK